jgi:hypothetical protein
MGWFTIMALLVALAACQPLIEPALPSAAAPTPTAEQSVTPDAGDPELSAASGLDPGQIALDTQGLPYPWQANAVAGAPYDNSQPPGPMGLPDHIQVNFGTLDPAQVQPTDPILYIVPVVAYQELWETAGNETVTQRIDAIYRQTVTNPTPPPTAGLPALPMERVAGVNDIAVQVDTATLSTSSASKNGFRFVGRFEQSPNPVTNSTLQYIYQGFTNDGKYLVLFFYPPAATTHLPNTAAEVPQTEINQVNRDPASYLATKAAELNRLPTDAWQPDLAVLDALVRSLTIANMPPTGIEGLVWQLVGEYDLVQETPLHNTSGYTISFLPDGQFAFQADCNSGSGVYEANGGMLGSLRILLDPLTPSDCGPDSLSNELIGTLQSAQNYKVRPGGQMLELVRPAGGGSLLFTPVGPADAAPSPAPTPASAIAAKQTGFWLPAFVSARS